MHLLCLLQLPLRDTSKVPKTLGMSSMLPFSRAGSGMYLPFFDSFQSKRLSPVVSSAGTTSVVPIESLLSDPYENPPFSPEASRIHLIGPGIRRANFLAMGSSESETPDTSGWQSDDSFVQHSKYFFKDGNVTFLVRRLLKAYTSNVLTIRRSIAFSSVSIVTCSLTTLCTFPLDSPNSVSVTTRLYQLFYR